MVPGRRPFRDQRSEHPDTGQQCAITGNYDRRGFDYVVAANEVGAGTKVVMVLLNEEMMRLTQGTSVQAD